MKLHRNLYSNKKDSIETITRDAGEQIEESNPEKVIVFVDLVGGSCWHAAVGLKRKYDNIAIIGGVNLPAIVSLATNINRLEWSELVLKLEEDAVKAIKVIK
jgi:mannose/fructose-specific phosphotransferase system component IIA